MNTNCFPGPGVLDNLQNLSEYQILILASNEYESSKQKWLYNKVIGLKGNIRVFCRCRPLNQAEITNGSSSIVEFDSSQENELQIFFVK
ncbi:hypothetical protein Patl1_21291 [Pistacia atlantica]|uniref:Uncharacterized protein n=1 Tax=Pistacia atlantica TaxID=434234 RepID=A0ACC1BK21_9ROSI|nr:hypothetical protein Patl1_21291 [Pistacia atlantica]